MLELPAKGVPESRKRTPVDKHANQLRPFLWPGRLTIVSAVVISPWCIASVGAFPQFLLHVFSLIALLFWWLDVGFSVKRRVVIPFLALPVIAGVLVSAGQLASLPAPVASMIAPKQYENYRQFADPIESESESSNATSGLTRISLQPDRTVRMLGILLVALNFMVTSAHFFQSRAAAVFLLSFVAANGVLLAVVGMLQQATNAQEILWTYKSEYISSHFSSFVNRNNAAGYLLMCLSATTALCYLIFVQRESGRKPRTIVTHELPLWRRIWLSFLLFISELNAKKIATILAIVLLTIGIFATLSRGGFIAGIVAAMATFWCFGIARKPENTTTLLVATISVVFLMTVWFTVGQRLVQRFDSLSNQQAVSQELRLKNWVDTAPAIVDYGLLGSGLATYPSVHRFYRSDPESKIFEYAENQYFQTAVENGWLGLLFLLAAILLAWVAATFVLRRGNSATTIAVGILGVFLLSGQTVAAFLDFGLYIPANTVLMAVLCGVVAGQAHALGSRLRKKNIYQSGSKKILVQLFLLCLFVSTVWLSIHAWRVSQIEKLVANNPISDYGQSFDKEKTEKEIKQASDLIQSTSHAGVYLHCARLHYHLYRLSRYPYDLDEFQKLVNRYEDSISAETKFINELAKYPAAKQTSANLLYQQLLTICNSEPDIEKRKSLVGGLLLMPSSETSQFVDQLKRAGEITEFNNAFRRRLIDITRTENQLAEFQKLHSQLLTSGVESVPAIKKYVWDMSSPRSVYSTLCRLRIENPILHDQMLAGSALQREFGLSRQNLEKARLRDPLNPAIHLFFVQLQAATGDAKNEHKQIDRLIAVAPTNPLAREIAAALAFESNQLEQAYEHWRRNLELDPRRIRLIEIMNRIRGIINSQQIYEFIIPHNQPQVMYWFCEIELNPEHDKQFIDQILQDALDLVEAKGEYNFDSYFLRGRIHSVLGHDEIALENLESAAAINKKNPELAFELARLYYRMNQLNKAKREIDYLVQTFPDRRSYKTLQDAIDQRLKPGPVEKD